MSRIGKKFRELEKQGKKALIVFVTAGYPDLKTTEKLVLELEASGADMVELGVPFSDPMADGPIIQDASFAALKNKVTPSRIMDLVKDLRRKTRMPILLMTYYNPVFRFGETEFARRAALSGVDGVIIPDLPPEEARGFIRACRRHDVDTVFFITPTTSEKRARMISGASRGFIYYVSLTGVTGPRRKLDIAQLAKNISRIRRITDKPVCIGFGISDASQVSQVQRISSGAIVGSAVVGKIKEYARDPEIVKKVGAFVRSLKR
jgi:tryptophan synthase alpha chain